MVIGFSVLKYSIKSWISNDINSAFDTKFDHLQEIN